MQLRSRYSLTQAMNAGLGRVGIRKVVNCVGGPRFKPDKEGEVSYTGISQSAIREMAVRYNPLSTDLR